MFKKDASLTELFNSYSKDVLHYSLSLLRNYDDAKDAVQEVFIRFIKSKDSFRSECSYKTWLLTITRNYCFMKLNAGRKNETESIDETTQLIDQPDFDNSISLKDAVNMLNKYEYELIYLREFACYSYKEISEILDISIDNVKTKLFRVRQKLRNYLK
jgi:RNA polymerase sigma-70 factor (ECF subfamily)